MHYIHDLLTTNPVRCSDDLLATNPRRVQTAVQKNACNCLTVKINQIGSLTEAFEACRLAKDAGWDCIVSHRCGETEDTFIADLAVGLGAGQVRVWLVQGQYSRHSGDQGDVYRWLK